MWFFSKVLFLGVGLPVSSSVRLSVTPLQRERLWECQPSCSRWANNFDTRSHNSSPLSLLWFWTTASYAHWNTTGWYQCLKNASWHAWQCFRFRPHHALRQAPLMQREYKKKSLSCSVPSTIHHGSSMIFSTCATLELASAYMHSKERQIVPCLLCLTAQIIGLLSPSGISFRARYLVSSRLHFKSRSCYGNFSYWVDQNTASISSKSYSSRISCRQLPQHMDVIGTP